MLSLQTATNAFDETYFTNINGSAFESLRASSYFREHFQADLNAADTLYLLLGTDSGFLPIYLENHMPNRRIIWIEHPQVLAALPELPPHHWSQFDATALETQLNASPEHLKVVLIPSVAVAEKTAETAYLDFFDQVDAAYSQWRNHQNRLTNQAFFSNVFCSTWPIASTLSPA
ncbi:MAG: hypothetical protein ACP5D0_07290 [Hydrogenovibrio sp.]